MRFFQRCSEPPAHAMVAVRATVWPKHVFGNVRSSRVMDSDCATDRPVTRRQS